MASTEPLVDPGPFDLSPDAGARSAVLCLHGLTGTPYEMRPLGEALAGAGLRAVGPVLPGHGETARVLARARYGEWVEAARERLHALRREHETVFVAGLSMGGLVTLELACEEEMAAAVVIGTPLRIAQPFATLIPMLRRVVRVVEKKVGSDIRDPEARARHPSMDAMPLDAVHQLMHLQRRVRERLPQVRPPLLVAHGAKDRTANPADALEIAARVASPDPEVLILERSGHVVPVDRDGPALAEAVLRFLVRHGASGPG